MGVDWSEGGPEGRIGKENLKKGLGTSDVERVMMAMSLRCDGGRFLIAD